MSSGKLILYARKNNGIVFQMLYETWKADKVGPDKENRKNAESRIATLVTEMPTDVCNTT